MEIAFNIKPDFHYSFHIFAKSDSSTLQQRQSAEKKLFYIKSQSVLDASFAVGNGDVEHDY